MPLDREAQIKNLHVAETNIANTEWQIAKHTAIRDQLHVDGHDTKDADRMLASLVDILETFRVHRELILGSIRNIDEGWL